MVRTIFIFYNFYMPRKTDWTRWLNLAKLPHIPNKNVHNYVDYSQNDEVAGVFEEVEILVQAKGTDDEHG